MKSHGIAVVVCFLLGTAGCATRVPFEASHLLPAAQVTAKVTRDQNQNALVDVVLEHMAPAQNLWPPKQLYMVWAEEADGKRLLPLGRLHVNEERQGRFQGTTPLDHFRLIISAEDEPNPQRPSLPYMLATEFVSP